MIKNISNGERFALETDPFQCMDCPSNTLHDGEYYMVRDSVWYSAITAMDKNGMLCVGCLEQRLGRELNPDDFTDAPLNRMYSQMSSRLRSRI